MNERCEWNPLADEPSYGGTAEGDCPNESWWSIGSTIRKNFHLCESCAGLPRFKRFKRRTPINANPATETRAQMNYHAKIHDGDYCGCCGRKFSGHNFFCSDCLGHVDKSQQYPWEMTWIAQHKAACPFEAEKI